MHQFGLVSRAGASLADQLAKAGKIRAIGLSQFTAPRLDQAMQRSVDSYKDPWLEAETPATVNQFTETLPLLQ